MDGWTGLLRETSHKDPHHVTIKFLVGIDTFTDLFSTIWDPFSQFRYLDFANLMTKDTCEVFVHWTLCKYMRGVNSLNDFKGFGYVIQLKAIVVEGSI